MANEPITDIILQTASGFYRRKIVAGMALALSDGALKVTDNSGSYTFPRADAAPVTPSPALTATAAPAPAASTPAATVPATAAVPIVFQPMTLGVGPSDQFQRIAQAMASLDGSKPLDVTLNLDPSVEHVNDTSSHWWESQGHQIDWPPFEQTFTSKLTMQAKPGSGKLAVLRSGPESLYYGKGIINATPSFAGGDQTYRQLHMIGAHRGDVDGRYASIWIEPNDIAATVTIEDCEIEQADTGILNGGPNMHVVLRRSYVHDCGSGSGYTHNAYIGGVASLLVEDVLSVRAKIGHLLKSRALSTTIRNTRLFDLDTGSSSYGLDLPNGGILDVDGLVIHRGPNMANAQAIRHGEEGSLNPNGSIKIRNLTVVADAPTSTAFGAPIALMNDDGVTADIQGVSVFGIAPDRAYFAAGKPADMPGGLTILPARPTLDLSSPVQVGS